MKNSILVLTLSLILAISSVIPVVAQEQPKPEKDSVNMDTEAKPEVYYDIEDDATADSATKSSAGMIAIIIGAVIVVGGAAFFLLKKKK